MGGYTKLASSIILSTVWREPNHIRLVWITMLALADKDGIVEGSIPGLADAARVSVPECEEALARLKSPDPYSRNPDYDGRRIDDVPGGWLLLNHALYRDESKAEAERERKRRWWRTHRGKAGTESLGKPEQLDAKLDGTSELASSLAGTRPPTPTPTPTPDPEGGARAGARRLSSSKDVDCDTSSAPTSPHWAEAGRLVEFMVAEMRKEKPDVVVRPSKSWQADMDKMLRLDKRAARRIAEVIRWACHHHGRDGFSWAANIRSPQKLRKHFDQLEMQWQRERDSSGAGGPLFAERNGHPNSPNPYMLPFGEITNGKTVEQCIAAEARRHPDPTAVQRQLRAHLDAWEAVHGPHWRRGEPEEL